MASLINITKEKNVQITNRISAKTNMLQDDVSIKTDYSYVST